MSAETSSSPFDDIHLGWQGKVYTIPANTVMGAIKRIEDHLTLAELQEDAGLGRLKLGRVAAAYAAVLRYAGASDATEDEVYAAMFGETEKKKTVLTAVAMLLRLMVPTRLKGVAKGGGKGEGNRRARRAAASSSRQRSG